MTDRRFTVKSSAIHGRGVFALRRIARGEHLLDYRGKLLNEEAALVVAQSNPSGFTMLVAVDVPQPDGTVSTRYRDGAQSGTSARYLNHSCHPNCRLVQHRTSVFVESIRVIRPGDELTLSYDFEASSVPKEERSRYACLCGHNRCRRTMLDRVSE